MKSLEGQDPSISTKFFFRSLSFRDFFTSFSLALLLIAIIKVINYYSDVLVSEQAGSSMVATAFLLIIPFNHIVYRIEHRRSNNFVGRVMHDMIFILLLFLLRDVELILLGGGHFDANIQVGELNLFCIGLILGTTVFEMMIALLKRILMLFKWQIL